MKRPDSFNKLFSSADRSLDSGEALLRERGIYPPVLEGDRKYLIVATFVPVNSFGLRETRSLTSGGRDPQNAAYRFSRSPAYPANSTVDPAKVVKLEVYDSRQDYRSDAKPVLSMGR